MYRIGEFARLSQVPIRTLRYHDQIGLLVSAELAPVRQLPAQRVAALVYRGDAEYLPAHRALRAWIGSAGLDISGSKRELFLRSTGSATEVQFPIARPVATRPARRAPFNTIVSVGVGHRIAGGVIYDVFEILKPGRAV